ncbi:UbiA family prenyltransferase [Parasediminibacterium sp. JCM 36343]|uniref:UbiA family prenyltransferase n=1 Tax=Parasediminibacterium sp. JCM 36343 TaxID=3374279 RepID=UPI003977EF1E
MLQKSTIQLLRFPFSFFLLPVYLFALSFLPAIHFCRAIWVFVLLHLLLYPASNGYNSYMDRDEGSIGGIKNPMQPTKQLFYATMLLDLLACIIALAISATSLLLVVTYIVFSRLYSYRGVRLKQFPIIGFLTVILNQGATIFYLVYHAASSDLTTHIPITGLIISTLLIGGFYPITQVYQHGQDAKDGVKTISMLLGAKGTFIFCAVLYSLSFGLLFQHFFALRQLRSFIIVQILFAPVIVYFLYWFVLVCRDGTMANFKHTMNMNWLASTCTNTAFLALIFLNH